MYKVAFGLEHSSKTSRPEYYMYACTLVFSRNGSKKIEESGRAITQWVPLESLFKANKDSSYIPD